MSTLPNGVTVLAEPDGTHPVVSVAAFIDTGSRTENETFSGALHLIEHLVYKGGTRRFKPTEFRRRLGELGQETGGWTSNDAINFGFTVPKGNLPEALDLLAESLLALDWDEARFADEKKVVLQELEKYEEEPTQQLWKLYQATAWTAHPYKRMTAGTRQGVSALTMPQVRDYYRERFVPNHLALAVSGDFNPKELSTLLTKSFGTYRPGRATFELGIVEPEQSAYREAVLASKNTKTTKLVLGVRAPPASSGDSAALTLLAWLLSSSSEGLDPYLTKGKERWALSAGAGYDALKDGGSFNVSAETEPARARQTARFLAEFLERLDLTKWPAEEFDEAKRRFDVAYLLDRETAGDRAILWGNSYCVMGEELTHTLRERVLALRVSQVQAVKDRLFKRSRMTLAMLIPAGKPPVPIESPAVTRSAKRVHLPSLAAPGLLLPAKGQALGFVEEAGPEGYRRFRYFNGLTLVVHRLPGAPLVSVATRVLGGQAAETFRTAGINRLTAQLLLHGTRAWDRDRFERLLDSLALRLSWQHNPSSRIDTSTQVDYRDGAGLHLRAERAGLEAGLAVVKEALFHPALEASELEKVRQDTLAAIANLAEDNLEYIKQQFYSRLFAGCPYGRPVLGTPDTLRKLDAEAVRAFHRAHFVCGRTVLSVVGDVEPRTLAEWVATRWSDLPSAPTRPLMQLEPALPEPAGRQLLERGRNQWTINFGARTFGAGDPRRLPAQVLMGILRVRHFFKYVYERGASYRSWFEHWGQRGSGAWIVENDVARAGFDATVKEIERDIALYSTAPFTPEELEKSKTRLTNGLVLARQYGMNDAWGLAMAESDGPGYERFARRVEDVRAVDLETVRRLAQTMFGRAYLELIMK
ncbi:MAG: insulinase family protein [Candidatus Wallbacteria bacterium]|nr:insulinase family protein [Candidatus Wallbacteria bacterium]